MKIARKIIVDNLNFENFVVRFATAWIFYNLFHQILNINTTITNDYFDSLSIVIPIIVVLAIYFVIAVRFPFYDNKQSQKYLLFIGTMLFFVISTPLDKHIIHYFISYRFILFLFILFPLTIYTFKNSPPLKFHFNKIKIAFLFSGVIMFAIMGTVMYYEYTAYLLGRWDFGVFTQMYEYLRQTGKMATTVERNTLISHFAVHFSPIYYFFYPIYYLFPSPITLQLTQAFAVSSSVIPLYLLTKHFKISNNKAILTAFLFLVNPCIIGSCYYGFHENFMYLPLLLWIFYFIEKKNRTGTVITTILILCIKEDACIAIAFIGIYLLLTKIDKILGSLMFATSCCYFTICMYVINKYGDGTVSNRHYAFGSSAFFGILKSLITEPAYFVSQCVSEEKIFLFIFMIVPFAFIPFINKNYKQLVLIIPLLFYNFLSMYPTQLSPYLYYCYYAVAIFFFLFLKNMNLINRKYLNQLLIFGFCSSILMSSIVLPSTLQCVNEYSLRYDSIVNYNKSILELPKSKTIAASETLIAHMYYFLDLYSIMADSDKEYYDYVIIDNNDKSSKEKFELYANNKNYKIVNEYGNDVTVFEYQN